MVVVVPSGRQSWTCRFFFKFYLRNWYIPTGFKYWYSRIVKRYLRYLASGPLSHDDFEKFA